MRFALHSRIMLHQPSGGFLDKQLTLKYAKEILDMKEKLNKIYEKHTKQKIDLIRKTLERDHFLSPSSQKFGT